MCFSAGASFGAGVLLTCIGVAAIRKTHHKSQLLFSGIPFLFGVQQLAEGLIWLTLRDGDHLVTREVATYTYLFFAQILWPVWVPIAILKLDRSGSRTKIQRSFVVSGIIVGMAMAYCLLHFHVEAKIEGRHITYFQDYPPAFKKYGIVFYALATIAPSFFSHIRRMWMLGTTILISYIVTAVFFEHYILSVWCFFSSIISLTIYAVMVEISNDELKMSQDEVRKSFV